MSAQPTHQTFGSAPAPGSPMSLVYSEGEYLDFEERAEGRWEFMDGRIIPRGAPELANVLDPSFRAGASMNHNELCRMLGGLFFIRLRDGYRAFTADARMYTPVSKTYSYPDLTVFYGPLIYHDSPTKTLSFTNPTILIEVLSKSTGDYDRSGKLLRYLSIESLQQYLMVDSRRMQVELYSRLPAGTWEYWPGHLPEHIIDLKSVGCQISLAELYAQVDFDSVPASAG